MEKVATSPERLANKSETGYDFEAMQDDLREMKELQESINKLASEAENISQSTPEE